MRIINNIIMKRYILTFVLVLTSLSAFCQNTIKFLGIPIEGTKKEMISKLQAKGYEYNSYADVLTGEFNGYDVTISVQTVPKWIEDNYTIDVTEDEQGYPTEITLTAKN